MASRRTRNRIRAAAVLTAAVTAVGSGAILNLAAASGAAPTPGAGPIVGAAAKAGSSAGATVRTVTLVTGDKAQVLTDPHGGQTVSLLPGEDGSVPLYFTQQIDGDQYVFPSAASKALAAGTVDPKLFDVTALIAQGYDDASSKALPLIAVYGSQQAADSSRQLRTRSAGTKSLPAVHGVAFQAPKTELKGTVAGLVDPASGRGTGGLTKLWLDKKVKAALQSEDQQIGAPAAWAAGLTGTGVKVAVLDTGIDADHPDLAGQVAAARNFTAETPDADVHDVVGHGTFVASEIAGTGAVSGGAQRGVADGAKLYVGKVLDDSGSGTDSQIIAGMQWAVDSGVDVASMSLGSPDPSDCTDPMSVAAENLAKSGKTLFVVAAGNIGRYESVSSPGCAPDVLTVGAVDSADKTAYFSSRGSVQGSHTLKPEIAAPGVDVIGAAAGGRGVYAYTSMSGTSMATPLVAGSAALVKQAHPEWGAAQIKAALVSSAKVVAGDVQETGAGRLSVGAAVKQTVLGSAAVQFGTFAYPQVRSDKRTVQVPYTNTGTTPVTLKLSLQGLVGDDGSAISGGALAKLGSATLSVAPGATASVPLTVDPTVHLKPGQYGDVTGRVEAVVSDGTTVSTAFNAYVEPEILQVRVRFLDRNGNPATDATADMIDLGQSQGTRQYSNANGEIDYTLRPGTYDLAAVVVTPDKRDTTGNALPASVTMWGNPEFKLTKDTVITVDARQADRVEVSGDKPLQTQTAYAELGRWWDNRWVDTMGARLPAELGGQLYVGGSGAAKTGGFEASSYFQMTAPQVVLSGAGGVSLTPRYPGYAAQAHLSAAGSARVVPVASGSAADLAAAAGKIALLADDGTEMQTLGANAKAAGAVAVLVYEKTPGVFQMPGISLGVPVFPITLDDATKLLGLIGKGGTSGTGGTGAYSLAWTSTPDSPFVYQLAFHDSGRVAGSQKHRVRDADLATVTERWHSMGVDTRMVTSPSATRPWNPGSGVPLGSLLMAAPSVQTVYVTPDDSKWQQAVQSSWPFSEAMVDLPRTFVKGQHLDQDWYKGVVRPTATLDAGGKQALMGERQGNLIGVDFTNSLWSDANPDHFGTEAYFGDLAGVELFAGDQSLGRSWFGPGYVWEVQPDATTYTLKLTQGRFGGPGAKIWQRSTNVETDFTFASHLDTGAYSQSLPLMFPSYDLNVDSGNNVAAGPQQITLSATGHQGYTPGAITAAKLAYSLDGGTTWVDAATTQTNGRWVASVDHSAESGKTVALRVTLADADGASVTQTVTAAYGVR